MYLISIFIFTYYKSLSGIVIHSGLRSIANWIVLLTFAHLDSQHVRQYETLTAVMTDVQPVS